MSIANCACKDVVTLPEAASLSEAAKLMKQKNVGSIVVVKNAENDLIPVGIITDRDIVTLSDAANVELNKVSVKDVVTKDLLVVKEDSNYHDAIQAMAEKGVRRAPVVDENGKLTGLISVDDLLVILIDKLSSLSALIKKQMS
jgi:CBS domain-containing protein